MSAAQFPLQHSTFEKQPPLATQQPPSRQACSFVQSALELQPETGGTQKPALDIPVQQAAAELVGPAPGMQHVPPSQVEPLQQSPEPLQELPGAAQLGPVVPPLLLLVEAALVVVRVLEPPVEPAEVVALCELELLDVRPPLLEEEPCDEPDELPPPFTGTLSPELGQEETANPTAPSTPRTRTRSVEPFHRTLRGPGDMPVPSILPVGDGSLP